MWASPTLGRDQEPSTELDVINADVPRDRMASVDFIGTPLLLSQIQRQNPKTVWLDSLTTAPRITDWIGKVLTWSVKCHKVCSTHSYLESLGPLPETAVALHYRKLECTSTLSSYTHAQWSLKFASRSFRPVNDPASRSPRTSTANERWALVLNILKRVCLSKDNLQRDLLSVYHHHRMDSAWPATTPLIPDAPKIRRGRVEIS